MLKDNHFYNDKVFVKKSILDFLIRAKKILMLMEIQRKLILLGWAQKIMSMKKL